LGPVDNHRDFIACGRLQGLRRGILDHQEALTIRGDVEVSMGANLAARKQALRLAEREGGFKPYSGR
jgi:hypothetical protein